MPFLDQIMRAKDAFVGSILCILISRIGFEKFLFKYKNYSLLQAVEFNPILLEKVVSSFNRMKKTDQEDYLKLHNNFDHIHSLPPQKYSILKTELEKRRLFLNSIEANKEKAEEMIKIFNIYGSNAFLNGVYLKMSRLNHSCRPNAEISDFDVSKPLNIKAMSKIKAGEEICIYYDFTMMSMNRQ